MGGALNASAMQRRKAVAWESARVRENVQEKAKVGLQIIKEFNYGVRTDTRSLVARHTVC